MEILLFLLKILLYILLFLLGIIALILFVPIYHNIEVRYNNRKYMGWAEVFWIFGAIYGRVNYHNDKINITLKVLGIHVSIGKKNPQNNKEMENTGDESENIDNITSKGYSKESKSKKELSKSGVIDILMIIWEYPEKIDFLKAAWIFLVRVYKALRPDVLSVQGKIGLDSPDTTAYVVGGCGVLNATLKEPYSIVLEGDFQNKTIDAKIVENGNICLIFIVIPLVQFIFSKPIWNMIKIFKNNFFEGV